MEEEKNRLLNAPNFLSLLRILLIPVFLFLTLNRKTLEAFSVFLLAGMTDILDGITARVWHQKTRIGSLLDPAADKLLMTTAFILLSLPSLSYPNTIPIWITATVIGRDILIVSGTLSISIITGNKKFNPSLSGKLCTFSQVMAVLFALFLNLKGISPGWMKGIFYLAFSLTLISGIQYMYLGLRILLRR